MTDFQVDVTLPPSLSMRQLGVKNRPKLIAVFHGILPYLENSNHHAEFFLPFIRIFLQKMQTKISIISIILNDIDIIKITPILPTKFFLTGYRKHAQFCQGLFEHVQHRVSIIQVSEPIHTGEAPGPTRRNPALDSHACAILEALPGGLNTVGAVQTPDDVTVDDRGA